MACFDFVLNMAITIKCLCHNMSFNLNKAVIIASNALQPYCSVGKIWSSPVQSSEPVYTYS